MSRKIFFLGNALLDITITCDSTFLQKYNLKPNNAIEAKEEHESIFSELLENEEAFFCAGGSAQNSARVAQWVLSGMNLSKQTTFVGCIGNDEFGAKLLKEVLKSGVHVLYDVVEGPTGVSAGLVNKENCSLVTRLGASALFNPSYLTSPEVQKEIETAVIIYVEGYFFSHNLICTEELAKYAEHNSKIFSLNLSAEYIAKENFGTLSTCVKLSGIVFGNEEEAQVFVRQCNIECSTIEQCALALSSLGEKPRIAVVTQGTKPVVLAQLNTVKLFEVPAVTDLVDTIGCGDAFVGGVLAALAMRKPIETAIHFGIYCAAEISRLQGCSLPFKRFDFQPSKSSH